MSRPGVTSVRRTTVLLGQRASRPLRAVNTGQTEIVILGPPKQPDRPCDELDELCREVWQRHGSDHRQVYRTWPRASRVRSDIRLFQDNHLAYRKRRSQGAQSRGPVKGAESGRMTRVESILQILAEPRCALGASQIARELNMNSVTGRLKKIFWMLLDDRIIERTELKLNSRLQKDRLTEKGRKLVASFKKKGCRK